MAMIQLKKVLVQNPKFIKAYHLLALLYLKRQEYEKARKLLKKAAYIDNTNTTTLRYLKEVELATGMSTSLETVSYTHLDVYKRQGVDIKALSEILGHASVNITLNRYVPVSYTHLDVYKRQVLCIAIFMVLGMWGMLSAHCLAVETNNDETQPQTIRIGSFEDTFDYVDQNGVRRGYGYELLQALAGYTGWKFEYVKCDWSNCFDKLENEMCIRDRA